METVKEVMFKAGAGRIGNYDSCSWQTLGTGQFRPLDGSSPFIGTRNKLETLKEYRVEMVCAKSCIHDTIKAMRDAHPYEEPAFDIVELIDI